MIFHGKIQKCGNLFLLRGGGAFIKGDQYNKRHSQPVWLVCWLIHLPGCFWRSVSASWTPPRSQFLSPAGCTANRLKKLLLAAPHLCLTRGRRKKSQMIYEHKYKHALSLKHWNTCHLIDSNTFLVPFLRQRSMLSVMVILLSEMNSYRMRVAIAVLSPSSAPCLVLALRKKIYIYINQSP